MEQNLNLDENIENLESGEVNESDMVFDETTGAESVLGSEEIPEEDISEVENSGLGAVPLVDGSVPVVLSDEVEQALLSLTPASGSIGSSTLDYFDRVVSGLPSDAVYVAYRTSADNSYNAVLYYGSDYEYDDEMDTLHFGDDAVQIHVERTPTSGYNNIMRYLKYSANDTEVTIPESSGDILYYSNVEAGLPILGGLTRPMSLSPLLVVGLLTAFAVVVLQKLLLKR